MVPLGLTLAQRTQLIPLGAHRLCQQAGTVVCVVMSQALGFGVRRVSCSDKKRKLQIERLPAVLSTNPIMRKGTPRNEKIRKDKRKARYRWVFYYFILFLLLYTSLTLSGNSGSLTGVKPGYSSRKSSAVIPSLQTERFPC